MDAPKRSIVGNEKGSHRWNETGSISKMHYACVTIACRLGVERLGIKITIQDELLHIACRSRFEIMAQIDRFTLTYRVLDGHLFLPQSPLFGVEVWGGGVRRKQTSHVGQAGTVILTWSSERCRG
jgi:hypothetical protein